MNYDVPKTQIYPLRLKGISVCFTILKAALCGNYVNFGVCKLYGDETLDNVLDITTKLILTIPQSELMVSKAFILGQCILGGKSKFSIWFVFRPKLGISETSTIILYVAGMLGTRSYGIPIDS